MELFTPLIQIFQSVLLIVIASHIQFPFTNLEILKSFSVQTDNANNSTLSFLYLREEYVVESKYKLAHSFLIV
jgi:hypothetical protein